MATRYLQDRVDLEDQRVPIRSIMSKERVKKQMTTNGPEVVTPAVTRWLRDYNEMPWRRYIEALRDKGKLLELDGILVDCSSMFDTPFKCDTLTCAQLDRDPSTESCCTDYEVEITPEEKQRILDKADEVIALLSQRDSERVKPDRDINEFFEETHQVILAKERGRCAFSYRESTRGQLRCGLHSLALETGIPIASIKPLTCVFFPVVVYRFENGDTFLTAISEDTSDLMEGDKDTQLPCLQMKAGDPMYMECRTAIETGFGEPFFQHLTAAAKEFAEKKRGKAREVQ
jgi:hypothetical protein